MLKRILAIILVIVISISFVPLEAFATSSSSGLTAEDVAAYLSAVYAAATHEDDSKLPMRDLILDWGAGYSFILCPMVVNGRISFDHTVFTNPTAGNSSGPICKYVGDLTDSTVKGNFKTSCESKIIRSSEIDGDIFSASGMKVKGAEWYYHGSIGVTESQNIVGKTLTTEESSGAKGYSTLPVYAWANLDYTYCASNCSGFARFYRVANTPKTGLSRKDMVDYAVSGFHLALYAKMLHKILSDSTTISKVESYCKSRANTLSTQYGGTSKWVDDGFWSRLKAYSFSDSTSDLLYRALTVATTKGAGDHCTVGVNTAFLQAADMFNTAYEYTSNDSDVAQKSFKQLCLINASSTAYIMLMQDYKVSSNEDDAVYTYISTWQNGELSKFMQDSVEKILGLSGSNIVTKDMSSLESYADFTEIFGANVNELDRVVACMFRSLFTIGSGDVSNNPWSLDSGWMKDGSGTYWTYAKFDSILASYINWCNGVIISDHFDNCTYEEATRTGAKASVRTYFDKLDYDGYLIMNKALEVSRYYVQVVHDAILDAQTQAAEFQGIRDAARDLAEINTELQTMGVNNAFGVWYFNAKLNSKNRDAFDTAKENIQKIESTALFTESGLIPNDFTKSSHFEQCLKNILDILASQPGEIPSLSDVLKTTMEKTSGNIKGIGDTGFTYTNSVDALLKSYCEDAGEEMWIRYQHYMSIKAYSRGEKWQAGLAGEMSDEHNVLIKSELTRLEAAYDAAIALGGKESLKTLKRALAYSDVLDFYAENGVALPVDDKEKVYVITKVMSDVKALGDKLSSPARTSYYAGSFTLPYPQDVYPYQLMLSRSICEPAALVFIELCNDIIQHGGANLTQLQEYIDCVDVIREMVNRYPNKCTFDLWYNTDLGDEEDKLAKPEGEDAEEITNFSQLYDYLINMGLLNGDEYMTDIFDENNPLTIFFLASDGANIRFSKDYYNGRALSATFIPMQTNTYDPYAYLTYMDTSWIETFHYNYGFHRKALLIDTNVDAAIDQYVSNTKGDTRVATLKDLFNPESDIVLYVDDNYYNLTPLAEQQQKAYDRLASTDSSLLGSLMNGISNFFTDMFEVRFEVALKQGEYDTYSDRIKENVSDLSYVSGQVDEEGKPVSDKKYDDYILDKATAERYLKFPDRYTELMGFAFVSLIYRDTGSYSAIQSATVLNNPVFVSSPTLATVTGVGDQERGSIYNYALLKNLPAMCSVGANQSLDMTSPIYIDIYGNIVTESGLVVIPAASNATLHNVGADFTPMTSGFLASYGKEWKIPTDWNLDETFMKKFFVKNAETNEWDVKNKTIQGMEIALAELSYSDTTVNQALYDWYLFDINNGQILNKATALNVMHEVMRGAPIENIDFDMEDLNLNRSIDKSGLIAAAKLDSIINSLNWDEDNSIMSVPNLSFIDNYQYVIVIVFKILLIIIVIALMMTVYIDVIKSSISFKTIFKCVGILVLGVSSVLLVPISYDIAYYQSNKALLQDEAEYILMLNTEKKLSGREIGISSVEEPKMNTQVMIKLEDFSFNWLECLPDVVFGDSITVLNEKYEEFLNESLICKEDLVQPMNDGIYVDVQDIFDTTDVVFNTDNKILYQNVTVDPAISYYIPYYYFLDSLILNTNKYNLTNKIYAYSTKIMRGGKVGTINLTNAFFSSKKFEESTDVDYLGLHQLYDVMGSMYVEDTFQEENIVKARSSQWFVGTMMDEEEVNERIDIMDTKVREFVANHRNLIGKVTDETFLKCMAMSLALEYNDLFGIPSASAYEVYNLSNTDLMRLTVCDKATTLEDSPMSFARFVYNEAGTPGVYASVFLVIVTMFVQTMKTIITIAIMVLLIVSVFVFKILLRKRSSSIAGYLLTLLVICSTNVLYAVVLKISLLIPQTGLAPTLCIIIQIIVQLAYLALLGIVLSFAIRDWKNAGFTFYHEIGNTMKSKISNLFNRRNQTPQERYDSKPRGKDGWDYYRKLVDDNEKRIKKVGNH